MSVSQAELQALIASLAPTPVAQAVLTCTVCSAVLDEVHRDIGTHPNCDPTPAQGGEEPPSTIAALRGILVDFEANSARTLQVAPGPSELAVPCDRRLAYRALSTQERPDGRVKWAPMLGTAAHALIADALKADNAASNDRWLIEERVHPDPSISGSCDAYDTWHDTVVDWKLVGPTRLTHYRRHGPGSQYEGQIQLYGRGWQRAGRTPLWVRIVFLARGANFDDAYEWTAPYSRRQAEEVMERYYRLLNLATDLQLAQHPELWGAVPASPGDACRFCPYLQRGIGAANGDGCPGDVAADVRRDQKLTQGLIV